MFMAAHQSDRSPSLSWKRAELAVNRFAKTVETDLERIKQLKKNIIEFEKNGDRSSVRAELNKTRQTVEHIKRNLMSIQALRCQIVAEDLNNWDARLHQVRTSIQCDIEQFSLLDADLVEYLGADFQKVVDLENSTECSRDVDNGTETEQQMQCQAEKPQKTTQICEATTQAELNEERMNNIAEDISSVREMMSSLQEMIHEQQDSVDGIDENVSLAHEIVKESGRHLNKAVALKAAAFPAIGAVCGALVGGPIGLVAGLKIGALAAGAGMAAGAAVGRKVRNVKLEANETELQNLNAAADMADTKVLRQEMVTYNKSSEKPQQSNSSNTLHQSSKLTEPKQQQSASDPALIE